MASHHGNRSRRGARARHARRRHRASQQDRRRDRGRDRAAKGALLPESSLRVGDGAHAGGLPAIVRERPGPGYRHVLRRRDVTRFLSILPEGERLLEGVDQVVLARGHPELHGWYQTGGIVICAWSRDLHQTMSHASFERERELLERLGVPIERRAHDVLARFDEETVRGFQLMEVLLHELGHHRDRVTTRSRVWCARGEPYAERYALELGERTWARYREAFGHA